MVVCSVMFGVRMEEELTSRDKKKEWIRVEIEIMRISALVVLAVGSGAVSLIIARPDTGAQIIFLAIGLVLSVTMLIIGVRTYLKLRRNLK